AFSLYARCSSDSPTAEKAQSRQRTVPCLFVFSPFLIFTFDFETDVLQLNSILDILCSGRSCRP
ncbi:MAG: hypothetical protein IJH70_13730, partial [Oscillospiraceae bacterium]|nr:hypothetical protein [Oscillospiraceae bacterium]